VVDDIESGTVIRNQAAIYFDFNEPIITNEWLLKADNDLPVSQINQLNDTTFSDEFMVHWSGNDTGSKIKYYDVVFKENGGNWYFAGTQLKDTFLLFQGSYDSYYEFYTIAYDNALNEEIIPLNPDVDTYVKQLNTGIDNQNASQNESVKFRPNPFENFLYADLKVSMTSFTVRVTNMTGTIVYQQAFHHVTPGTIELNLQTLPPGVYILNYNANDQVGNAKFVKY